MKSATTLDPFHHEMLLIPGGSFQMGDVFQEGMPDEKPVHPVQLPNYYLSPYPVTQAQWEKIMGYNPCYDKSDPQLPVVEITWYETQAFLEALNQLTGLKYRLPSEAEWEYAAREKGQKIRFGNGKDLAAPDEINFDAQHLNNNRYTYGVKGESRKKTTPVGSFSPNALGLYDLSGNVWEWCADVWHNNYDDAPDNGRAWVRNGDQEMRIVRGGSWLNDASGCRATYRGRFLLEARHNCIGFRIARS